MNPNDPLYDLFLKVARRHRKSHIIASREKTVGHSLAIGNPGHGKTSSNRREIELRWALNHKIFCLYDAGRMDMAFFMFPSVADFWKVPKLEGGKIVTPRRYPVELLYPVTKALPRRLPNWGRPFTIPVSSLDEKDITALVGLGARDTVKGVLYYMDRHVKSHTTPYDYLNLMGAALKKVADSDAIKPSHHGVKKLKSDAFMPLINEGLLSSDDVTTAINFKEIIKDRKTISVLVLRHAPQHLWGFLVHYFMNHISNHLAGFGETKRIRQNTTFILNEVADLLSKDEEGGGSSDSISRMISKIAKQSRTNNIFMLLDTQIPQELPDIKDTMNRIYVFNSGVAEVQKAMEIIGISTRSGEITPDDLMIIPRLGKGYYYLFDRANGVSLHKAVWTRSRSWLDGEDFYDVYNQVYGKMAYYDTAPYLEELAAERRESEAAWKTHAKVTGKKAPAALPSAPIESSDVESDDADDTEVSDGDDAANDSLETPIAEPERQSVEEPVSTETAIANPDSTLEQPAPLAEEPDTEFEDAVADIVAESSLEEPADDEAPEQHQSATDAASDAEATLAEAEHPQAPLAPPAWADGDDDDDIDWSQYKRFKDAL